MIHRHTFQILSLSALILLGASACQPVSATVDALPAPTLDTPKTTTHDTRTAVLAGGCFWGIEAVFERVDGVREVTVGYSGGRADTASYDKVSRGYTGHAESVKIEFDPARVSYGKLLQVFFSVALDPTQKNRQGPDTGTQYRSVIFHGDTRQKEIAEAYIAQLDAAHVFPAPIATRVQPLRAFYPAEAYHQQYYDRHPAAPYIVINDMPKVHRLKALFPNLYRDPEKFVEVNLH